MAALIREGLQVGADANIKTVTGVYEAFGRGDVAAIQTETVLRG